MDNYQKRVTADLYEIYIHMGMITTPSDEAYKIIEEIVNKLENPQLTQKMCNAYRKIHNLPICSANRRG